MYPVIDIRGVRGAAGVELWKQVCVWGGVGLPGVTIAIDIARSENVP